MSKRSRPLALVSLAALLLAACSRTESPLDLAADAGELSLVGVQPASGAVGVDPESPVVLRFSRPMMTGMGMLVVLHEGAVGGAEVAVSATWSADRTRLTLVPQTALRRATTYVVHLSPSLMDAEGHMIDLSSGMMMGGVRVAGGMMGAGSMMSGQWGPGMMGAGWRAGDGTFGMTFSFTTA